MQALPSAAGKGGVADDALFLGRGMLTNTLSYSVMSLGQLV